LSPEEQIAVGVMELGLPGEYDFIDLFDTIRAHQEIGTYDYIDTIYDCLDEDDPQRQRLETLVSIGSKAVGGSEVFVDVNEYNDKSYEGSPLGGRLHQDGKFSMIVTEKLGTLVLADPNNPDRFLKCPIEDIGDEATSSAIYTLRPDVLTIMHSNLWHIRPLPGMLQEVDPNMGRRSINVLYAKGVWPENGQLFSRST